MSIKCAVACDCNVSLENSGVACVPLMKVIKKFWAVNAVKADGSLFYIDLSTPSNLNDAYFLGLINAANAVNRLYPYPEVNNVEDKRDTPVYFEWRNGTKVFIRDGVRAFNAVFPPDVASPQLVGILETLRCSKAAIYGIDEDGTIYGKLSADGTKLYPIRIDAQSVAPIFMKPTDAEPQMVGVSFNYHPSEKDCQIRGLYKTELTGGINPLDYEGLLNVYAKVIACTTTKLTVKLYTDFGTPLNPFTDKGLLVTNFTLINVTDTNSAIALTGTGAAFAENSDGGTYELTYATADAPTSADVLKLTVAKNGRDYKAVALTSVVVS